MPFPQHEIKKIVGEVKAHLRRLGEMGVREIHFQPAKRRPPEEVLAVVREEIGDCTRCKLCQGRTKLVFGVGNPRAELMFIGEGPGRDEDLQGEPFVGRAGQLLTRMIEAMGWRREEVYIANVVKCRPPENRLPEPEEVETCLPFLVSQIAAIRPKVIVTLGGLAVQSLMNTKRGITQLRGEFLEHRGIPVMPTFHPAYLLRNPAMKKPCWEDLKKVLGLLQREARAFRLGGPPSAATDRSRP